MFKNKYNIIIWSFLATLILVLALSTFDQDNIANVAFAQFDKETTSVIQLLKSGDSDGAIRNATEYLKANPNNVNILNSLAEAYKMKDDAVNFEKYAKRAIEIEPNNPWSCKLLSQVYRTKTENKDSEQRRNENLTLAAEAVERGLTSNPNDILLLAEKAQIYFERGAISTALQAINQALKIAPDDAYLKELKEKIMK